jgi:putative transcriptional regulator
MNSFFRLPTTIVSLLGVLSLLAFLSLVLHAPAHAAEPVAEPAETLVLVARPAMTDPLYGQSILVAHEMPGGQHVGFILNRPTDLKLDEAFPGHEASKSVTEPLYLGGPSDLNAVFALVHSQSAPKEGTLPLTDDIYLAISESAVDEAMTPGEKGQSRFFAGAVVWRPGELAEEIRRGAWYVLEATAERVLPKKTAGLWENLVKQVEIVTEGI